MRHTSQGCFVVSQELGGGELGAVFQDLEEIAVHLTERPRVRDDDAAQIHHEAQCSANLVVRFGTPHGGTTDVCEVEVVDVSSQI